ncbi:GAF domain-containing protein [bacterium]|nr:GAF domain-containing protein [bacterium]
MNLFSLSGLIIIATCSVLLIIIFIFGKNRLHKIWAIFNFVVIIWGIGSFLVGIAKTETSALFAWRLAFLGALFTCVFFYHTVFIFSNTKKRTFLIFAYTQGIFFAILTLFTNLIFDNWRIVFNSIYYNRATLFYYILLGFWTFVMIVGHYKLFKFSRNATGIKHTQGVYLCFGSFIGHLGGVFALLPAFGIDLYPISNFAIPIYSAIVTYGILRYRLLDITIVITRTGIFIAVYSLVLGSPFLIAYSLQTYLIGYLGENWWFVPMGVLTVLATVGPFIYIFFNSKAEERLLRTQRQYQNTLRQASSGMIRIRNLRELLNLIVHVITKTVKLESAAIFLLNSENTHYKLAAKRDSSRLTKDFILERNSPLIKQLNLKREPIVYEEIQLQIQDNPRDSKMAALEKQLKEINTAIVVPSFVGNRLLGFLVLGKKLSGKLYSQDDLNVFSVLANQAALAIENAQFYEDIKETQEQLFQAEKMATIGTMADGLSHQVNNRFQALSLIAGDSLDILQTIEDSKISSKVKDSLSQLKHAFERIQANVIQGGEIVKGLLKYSRPGQRGFEFVNFNKIVDGALEMVQYKVRLQELDIKRIIPKDLPKLKCNLTQLEEVFFNLIDNAYDAIKERKEITAEEGFKGNIIISAVQKNEYLWITFQDNGIGFKDKDKEKVFTPFFTTKATSKKGTGLGLYVIQKIVNFHNGTVSLNSTYNKGTRFEIVLPLSKK